ncbi:MAG: hypothetical protein LBI79_10560 [Nitrososphaerota archaeon]|jgi:hypothetical protein|nr:hypothetical protein [Nitrososphaerota archaeon]
MTDIKQGWKTKDTQGTRWNPTDVTGCPTCGGPKNDWKMLMPQDKRSC